MKRDACVRKYAADEVQVTGCSLRAKCPQVQLIILYDTKVPFLCMYVCMHVCIYIYIYGWLCVCMYV